jgi:hypothetical protein
MVGGGGGTLMGPDEMGTEIVGGSGTINTVWHFWQRTFLPARSSASANWLRHVGHWADTAMAECLPNRDYERDP